MGTRGFSVRRPPCHCSEWDTARQVRLMVCYLAPDPCLFKIVICLLNLKNQIGHRKLTVPAWDVKWPRLPWVNLNHWYTHLTIESHMCVRVCVYELRCSVTYSQRQGTWKKLPTVTNVKLTGFITCSCYMTTVACQRASDIPLSLGPVCYSWRRKLDTLDIKYWRICIYIHTYTYFMALPPLRGRF